MALFFLIIIYLAFISLGLPDSLLGSAWPVMHSELSVGLSRAGNLSMIISGGTIISSFLSEKVIRKFGTGRVTFISVLMTAGALLGFSILPSFLWLCLAAIPLGLGAGAVDSALNNFVALHYKAKHMSWLHCFWGVGATLGPVIMSMYISKEQGWRKGYLTIGIIQLILVLILFITLPLWKRFEQKGEDSTTDDNQEPNAISTISLINKPGVKVALLSFLCYCAAEAMTGLWGSSYLVKYRGVSVEAAARWISLFYLGITIGRLVSGFAAMKINNLNLIRIGQGICGLGIILLFLPLPPQAAMAGLILIGLGCAPIYPSMLHETPNRFGKELSQSIMGIQMAFAYMGSTFIPPIFGLISTKAGMGILPVFLLISVIVMTISSERINHIAGRDTV